MPSFDIIKENKADKNSFRVQSVIGMFDLSSEHIKEHFSGNIDLPENWNVGIIVGASGTGKSTIMRELFNDYVIENNKYEAKSVIDDMPKDKTVKEITQAFNSVGFSSPPSWLKPYSVLSNGEKMRVDLANGILSNKDIIVFDEFTSVVNREVAKIGSCAIQKAIRKQNKKFIAVSCHYDIIDWLEPDWIFCTDDMSFQRLKKRPKIDISIYECDKSLWKMFRKYHYLDTNLNTSAKCYCMTVNNKLAGFMAIIHFPHPIKCYKKVHRLVILPDYQGIGLGKLFLNEIGKMLNYAFAITTSQPALINCLKKSKKWICTRNTRNTGSIGKELNKTLSNKRITTTFVYKGENND